MDEVVEEFLKMSCFGAVVLGGWHKKLGSKEEKGMTISEVGKMRTRAYSKKKIMQTCAAKKQKQERKQYARSIKIRCMESA